MQRIVLFRFHHEFDVCRNRLELLRLFNPRIDVYGLYGGPSKNFSKAKKLPLEHVWEVPLDDPYWKWVNGDLCIRWWFKDFGRMLDFDILHVWEWDMVLLESIESQLGHIEKGVAITGVRPIALVLDTSYWVGHQRGRREWLQLMAHVKKSYNYDAEPVVGIYGGACLSRKFLERYAKAEVPSWCNDEVRTALFAQAFKMPIADTNLFSSHFSSNYRTPISADMVYDNYAAGALAFHPVWEALALTRILRTKEALANDRTRKSAEAAEVTPGEGRSA